MAGWIDFKLGRPTKEFTFTVNPAQLKIEDGPVDVINTSVKGNDSKSIVRVYKPKFSLSSNYLTKSERDILSTLANTSDTFLSFQIRDDWQVVLERRISTTISSVYIPESSMTRLDTALIAAGGSGQITINGVFNNALGTGTNYFSGGSYAPLTRLITLGTPLAGANTECFVTYTYKGWLVNLRKINHSVLGGWVDKFQYDFSLEAV